jgi:hypothetical protein
MFGLGLTFMVGALVMSLLGEAQNAVVILVSFLVAVASGAIEATIVGLAQWWAMHPWLPAILRRDWWLATLFGALLAYVLGYLPTTLMSLTEQSNLQGTPVQEPDQWVVLLLAAGLGLVGGAVQSFAQWLVLRKKVSRANVWIPANMLAWLVGMPLIFWGIDKAGRLESMFCIVGFMAGVLLLAGLVVGAIHGAFLLHIVSNESST